MYFRYKYKQKEKNLIDDEATVYPIGTYETQRFRYQCDYSAGSQLSFRSGIDYNRYQEKEKSSSTGFALSQSVGKSFTKVPLALDAQVLIFDTDGFDNAIYSSEKNVLYAFAFPAFSGKGYRYSLNAEYDFNSKIAIWLKYGITTYVDREVISSGLEEIVGKSKRDVYFLLRWKFWRITG